MRSHRPSSFVVVELLLAAFACIFYFVTAIIVSVGFANLCKAISGIADESCSAILSDDNVNADGYCMESLHHHITC